MELHNWALPDTSTRSRASSFGDWSNWAKTSKAPWRCSNGGSDIHLHVECEIRPNNVECEIRPNNLRKWHNCRTRHLHWRRKLRWSTHRQFRHVLLRRNSHRQVTYSRLPRQPASVNGATTPGFSGPFPSECVVAAHAEKKVPFCFWQLGSFLFGMPAQGPSSPLLVGFRVAALALSPPLHGAGSHWPTVPEGRLSAGLPNLGCPPHGFWASHNGGVV